MGASENPCLGIERYAENARERYLTSEEFARLGDALRLAETTGLEWAVDETKPKANRAPKPENRARTLDPFAVAAIRLLILTGARLREILHARWEHADIERGVIFLVNSKTGRKPVYLSAAALEVLAGLPRIEGNPYIIPGSNVGQPKVDLKKPWAALCKAAELDGVRLHDLRHSFASIGASRRLRMAQQLSDDRQAHGRANASLRAL